MWDGSCLLEPCQGNRFVFVQVVDIVRERVLRVYYLSRAKEIDLCLFRSSISFVSACYVYIAVATMSLVMIQQLVLISQNLTQVEWRRATSRGWTCRWLPFIVSSKYNVNDRGFCRNWQDFLSNRRRQRYVTVDLPG